MILVSRLDLLSKKIKIKNHLGSLERLRRELEACVGVVAERREMCWHACICLYNV